ncbi:hypothetical protein [Paractinoplanes durhamensis]|uniref:hypothetical protein n=1 Tax=Paractinoplanes durhamensis TaxID=113563 RepID=UPI00362D5B8A
MDRNPAVIATDDPPPHAHTRRFYIGWASGLLPASILLAVVLANDGREDSIVLWMLVPVLFFTGIGMALKIPEPAKPGTVVRWPR